MSAGRDDCGLHHETPDGRLDGRDTEPADPDPSACDHTARRELPLAPDTVKGSRLPGPLTDDGRAVTVAEAGETYLKMQRSNWKDDALTSKYERHRYRTYPRILEADRHFQAAYDGVTTVMLTRRLSPLDERGDWLTPWECNEMLHGGKVHRSMREAWHYQLDSHNYEWIAVTAPTRSAGTPHEHIYMWIDDPENQVTVDQLKRPLDKHLKYCANAYREHHRYRADGTGGAIRVQHSPSLIEKSHDRVAARVASGDTLPRPNTAGAQYIASQLAHLPVGDFYAGDQPDPPKALFEGAALAWASPRNWFRDSRGVPGLE